jgi:ArsR family transcriptional regulator, cadmium/lead-responsive transcriptional repressor
VDWESYSFVLRSKRRLALLLALRSELTPTQLAEKESISIKNISKLLGELKEQGLVMCLTPNARKGRVYSITSNGEDIIKKIKKG